MSTNRTNIKFNRTLLILLGILLACLLTLNAKSLYSADLLSNPTKTNTVETIEPQTLLDQISKISFKEIHKKITSLN